MSAITRLCTRGLLLEDGRVLKHGAVHEVVSAYLQTAAGTNAERRWDDLFTAPGDDVVRMIGVRVRTEDGTVSESMDIRRPIGVDIEYVVLKSGTVLVP